MRPFGASGWRWSLLLVAACSSVPNAPPAAFCPTNASPHVLAVGEYAALRPVDGCVVFPANASTTGTVEYLLVPQATTGTPDLSASFKLAGSAAAAAAPAFVVGVQLVAPPRSPVQRFHDRLRELERTRAYGVPGAAAPALPTVPVAPLPTATIAVGDTGRFKVLNTLTGFSVDNVTAVARKVGQHIAIFTDTGAPKPGLSATDLDTLRSVFDSVLYPTDTSAFGRESDIDGNGVVIVLLTNTVNKMVQDCSSGYVAGFFFGGDIDPFFRSRFNSAEIFYTIVPDPGATLSCAHSVSQVKRLIPTTFVHEFQHMISYNQHVLVRGNVAEELWLNEGMSHYAEERGGRAFLPGDSTTFCGYVRGDLSDAALYWTDLGSHPLVDTSGIGGLAERGAGWLFVRYLADRYAQGTGLAGQDAFTRKLDNTSLTGAANVAAQANELFATIVERWALANWVSDLPGFTAPPELVYTSWAFRTDYPKLNARCTPPTTPAAFPLVALAGAPASVSVSGSLRAGTGAVYQRVLQGPGAGAFQVLFSDGNGAQLRETTQPRLNVIRIR